MKELKFSIKQKIQKKIKNNFELINDKQYNNTIPRNTLGNNDIIYLNSKSTIYNIKKISSDGDNRNNKKIIV